MTNELDQLDDFGDDIQNDELDSFDGDDFDNEQKSEKKKPKESKKKPSKKAAPKSPLASRGKSPSGNLVFGIIVFIVAAAGFGYLALEELMPAYHIENLVSGDSEAVKDSVDYFKSSKENKWFNTRVESLINHPRKESRRFACRALTQLSLGLDVDERREAVDRLQALLSVEKTPDEVHAEVIHDLGKLGSADSSSGASSALASAVKMPRESGVGLTRENRHFALQTLNMLEGESVDSLMLSLIEDVAEDSNGRDLMITAFEMIGNRLLEATESTSAPHDTSSDEWEHHVTVHQALVNGYLYHEDQRVRRECWNVCEKLKNPRGLELWVHSLKDSELLNRIVAVTLLRRFSDQMFDFDPYLENADTSAWENWVSSANP